MKFTSTIFLAAAGVISLTGVATAVMHAQASKSAPSLASNSCGVITQAEASAALGQTVKPPVSGKATVEGGVACVFYGPLVAAGANPDVPVLNSVRVVLVRGDVARSFFDDYRKKVRAVGIPGLGDDAYFDGGASVSVMKGSAYVRIAVIGAPNTLEAEKMLAAHALTRM